MGGRRPRRAVPRPRPPPGLPLRRVRGGDDRPPAARSRHRPPGHPPPSPGLVGAYGLRVEWSDGHGTGIYTFRWLRDRCPCEACTAGAVPVGAP
ncbi:MAG: DUF971 domain-containing protein [Gemmatimonadetes bacterium]|nr:DUF971 domain-containing protein [Gemmatimonadota bacterium]